MTVPDERTNSIIQTRQFLLDLRDPKKTPKVPSKVRERAHRCLRHFPGDWHLDEAASAVPDTFGKVRA